MLPLLLAGAAGAALGAALFSDDDEDCDAYYDFEEYTYEDFKIKRGIQQLENVDKRTLEERIRRANIWNGKI